MALVASAVGMWVAPGAHGEPPLKQGWWSRWQQPTATTLGIVLPVTIPPPPNGDTSGLTIARDASGVQAVAAVEFSVELGADATLYLDFADDRQMELPEDAQVHACVATSSWRGEMNGAWANAPAWGDCNPGAVNQAQPGLVFTLSPWMQDDDGIYSIVIVPNGSSPYLLNFSETSDTTLVPGEPQPDPETPTTTTTTTVMEETSTTTTPVETTEETEPFVSYEIGGERGGTGPGIPVVTTTTAAPPKQPTTLAAFGPGVVPDFLPIPDSRGERIFAVSLLFFMAVALWWLGGSPARMPRLIGALAASDARPRRVPAPHRGIGRFARPRDLALRPPRL